MGRFVTSLKTTGDRCLISLPCSPGSLRNLPEGNPARLITHKGSNKIHRPRPNPNKTVPHVHPTLNKQH